MTIRTRLVITALVLAAASTRVSAQQTFQTLGPNECLNCHDHDAERQWYEKKEIPEVQRLFPDREANAGHINSLKQLEAPKSKEFADAIGLKDKYDVAGACVSCHATVFAGDANAGVSCESCHGAASGYLKPHQTKDAYDASVAQYGMTRLVGNIRGWTQQCTNCHVMNDDRLIKAGHPSGDDWELAKKYLPVSIHFKKKYDTAEVAAIAGPEMAGIIRRRRPNAPAPPPVVVATEMTAPAATNAPAGSPAPAEPVSPVTAPAGAAPAGRPAETAAPTRPITAAPQRAVAVAPPPGSPTSIEPPAPIDVPAAPVTTTTAAPATSTGATPAVAVRGPELKEGSAGLWLIVGGVAVILVGGFLWFRRRKT